MYCLKKYHAQLVGLQQQQKQWPYWYYVHVALFFAFSTIENNVTLQVAQLVKYSASCKQLLSSSGQGACQ